MKKARFVAVLTALVLGTQFVRPVMAGSSEGVGLAIIYDTSGSMSEKVRGADGNPRSKYLIANSALTAIAQHIQAYASAKGGSPADVQVGLYTFRNHGGVETIPFGPFDAQVLERWAASFDRPSGDTPLGKTLTLAGERLLQSNLPRKHILVITDGMNTAGPDPATVMPQIKKSAQQKGSSIDVHFVAFDVDAKVFSGVKRLGATVLPAANEKQLNSQLDFILRKKILLEEEEPPQTTAK